MMLAILAEVLVASLSMPLLMHWTTVTITLNPLPVPTPDLWPANSPLPELLRSSPPSELGVPVAAHGGNYETVMASGPRRKTDRRTLGCQHERAREPCHRRAGHLRIDHPASSSIRRLVL